MAKPTKKRITEEFDYPLSMSLGFLVRITHRIWEKAVDNRVSPHGITIGMWGHLRILWEEDGMTIKQLGNNAGVTGSTTVTAVDSMERAGIVKRRRSESDRRSVEIFLTRKGKALKSKLLPYAMEVNEIAVADVSKADLETFEHVLGSIYRSLQKDEQKFASTQKRKTLLRHLRDHDAATASQKQP